MPDLDAVLAQKLIDATVDFGPEAELAFSFDANKVTPLWFDQQKRGLDAGEVLTVSGALAQVIVNWNLTSGEEAVPVSPETLSRFPMGHLNLLMEVIAEQPTRAEGEGSGSTPATPPPSSTPAPELRPNGQEPSRSPEPSESLSTR